MKKLTKIIAVSAVALSTTAYAHNNDLIKDKAQAKQVCQIEKVDQVFKLMSERATLISEVAANKYITGGSVYTAPQEDKVLLKSNEIANDLNLNQASLMIFTQVQMDVSKQIETYWINYWKDHPKKAPTKESIQSLTKIRDQLVKIDTKLYPAIKKSIYSLKHCNSGEVQNAYNKYFDSIKGIPLNPNYNAMFLQSVKNIKVNR